MKFPATLIVLFTISLSSAVAYGEAEIYRVVIGFYSICCGPDPKDEIAAQEFIKSFEKKHQVKLRFSHPTYSRGLEGEWAKCFKLDELSEQAQIAFVEGIRKVFEDLRAGKDRSRDGGVTVDENTPC